MDDNSKILNKIKKCMALSSSSNEHEAAAALRQARKLMEAHGITDLDMQAAEAEEHRAKAGAKVSPANWEAALANKVGWSFGCQVIFSGGGRRPQGEWCFIGCGVGPEVAHYAFAVLYRQAKQARDTHIKTKLKRCKVATKTRRADLFCEGYVASVTGIISAFSGNEQQATAINAYLTKRYPNLRNMDCTDRNGGRKLRGHEYDDLFAGEHSGREAKLNRGVGGHAAPLLNHPVIHKSVETELTGKAEALDKDSQLLHSQPDRLDTGFTIPLAAQKAAELGNQANNGIGLGHHLWWPLLVQDKSSLPFIGFKQQVCGEFGQGSAKAHQAVNPPSNDHVQHQRSL